MLPGGHSVHVADPASAAMLPERQGTHVPAPVMFFALPAAHFLHVPVRGRTARSGEGVACHGNDIR